MVHASTDSEIRRKADGATGLVLGEGCGVSRWESVDGVMDSSAIETLAPTDDRSTCYRLDQDQLHVSLWGFGMFFGRRELGGLYLDRFDFRPRVGSRRVALTIDTLA